MEEEISVKEKRIRNTTGLYYSRKDIQKAIFDFSKNREISPRYFEGFGKRPDSFQYMNEVYEFSKKGATSFHCSEELWEDPLQIETGMNEKQLNEFRIGWDLLIDIDCKWFDYSKLAAKALIETLEEHKLKNIGLKFSGSKGWHILIPWKAFPKEINGVKTSDLFPELPRQIMTYLRNHSQKIMQKLLPSNFHEHFKGIEIKRGHKCRKCGEMAEVTKNFEFKCVCGVVELKKFDVKAEIPTQAKCHNCKREMQITPAGEVLKCNNCHQWKEGFENVITEDLFELMGLDLVLISPRHLFRMPYSLHEKTALASIVIDTKDIDKFEMKDADHMSVKIKNFMPDVKEGEAEFLVREALDWIKTNQITSGKTHSTPTGKFANFKPIKLTNVSEENFPPCVKNILKGISDGKKRALFVLIALFRSVGMDKEELEKKIYDWNKKNDVPMKEGYIKSQLSWAYRRKPIMPQNCKEFYQGIGVCQPDTFCGRIKNPLNYTIGKNLSANKKSFLPKKSKPNKNAQKKSTSQNIKK
jgi:DNA primase catalytic subunit